MTRQPKTRDTALTTENRALVERLVDTQRRLIEAGEQTVHAVFCFVGDSGCRLALTPFVGSTAAEVEQAKTECACWVRRHARETGCHAVVFVADTWYATTPGGPPSTRSDRREAVVAMLYTPQSTWIALYPYRRHERAAPPGLKIDWEEPVTSGGSVDSRFNPWGEVS